MLLKFKKKNVGPMEDKELVFAPHVNVFTGDNSLDYICHGGRELCGVGSNSKL